MTTVFTANSSSITVDGSAIEGVQGIDYRAVRQFGDVYALGSDERVAAYYGATRVEGRIRVASANPALDGLTTSGSTFQIVANLAHGQSTRSVSFDECMMKDRAFSLNSGGHAETVYAFSAVRVREEDAAAAT